MNVLCLYNATQTYTATVFEHLSSFRKYSEHRYFFAHQDSAAALSLEYSHFDAVVIHYTIRLPFDQIAEENAAALTQYRGLKVLFIQDEYDHPHRVWHWIRRLGIGLVFTVVPNEGISRVYPAHEFPAVRFVSVLTGYVPEDLTSGSDVPPSQRPLVVGYRGRPLPIRYGDLGREKISIGQLVAKYCRSHNVRHDVNWTEESRIYGPKWYQFMSSCKSMLGSESGSNVFDWDGTLAARIQTFRSGNPHATDEDVYTAVVRPLEQPGLMNQVSPRIFEAIAARTVLVLFEGAYSGVVSAGEHFIPLNKDGSNLGEVFRLLEDGAYVDAMAERAYRDVIASGKYSYRSFVAVVDLGLRERLSQSEMVAVDFRDGGMVQAKIGCPTSIATAPMRATPPQPSTETLAKTVRGAHFSHEAMVHAEIVRPSPLATAPVRAAPPQPSTDTLANTVLGARGSHDLVRRFAIYLWWKLPETVRVLLRPHLKRLRG